MEETRLGGMSVKWQNGTDQHMDTPTPTHRHIDEKRAWQTLPLSGQRGVKALSDPPPFGAGWCKSNSTVRTVGGVIYNQRKIRLPSTTNF
jgi:hypothetical protein